MKIQHITELFSFDGERFVEIAYENLLRRPVDEQGMRYYLGRLALGHSRQSILLQLAQSPELRDITHIQGLPQLIKQERFRQSVLGRLLRFLGINKAQAPQTAGQRLNELSAQLGRSAHAQSEALKVFDRWSSTFETIANRTGLATPIAQTAQADRQDCLPLSKNDVIRSFQIILRRSPENEAEIRAHQAYATPKALQAYLRQSAEYQSRTASLSAPARRAYYLLQAALPISTPSES